MAKILFTAVVADMRNKLNGTVFSKNRYGAYARTKVTPVNPQSTAQQAARNRLSTNSQAWRDLTESQRQGWINGAVNFPFTDIFGNSKTLSGSALYVKLNGNLAGLGLAAISDCPLPVAIPSIESLAVSADESTGVVNLTFAASPVPADFALVIDTTGNVTPGKSFVKNLFRYVSFADSAATSPAVITTEFAAVHGAPVAGNKVFARARYVSKITGQSGIPFQATTIVVP